MSLPTGERLGPYEIVATLGEGGMGEIYRARDTRLDRTVALKVSKADFTDRFEREARAVAALNHPNICTLHDVGPNYLVMELVEGAPLAGPVPVERAVEYAGQILDALDAAHRQGITHRDLKPANILVTKHGIKLLDFGLAIRTAGPEADRDLTLAAVTMQGQIVGTLQYMSPEQLHGTPADARSDIFAFGCVLYEMLSGRRAFDGSSQASVIAAILEREPPSLLRSSGGPGAVGGTRLAAIDRVIATCLAKDPDARFQNARDLKRALAWAMEAVAASPAAAPPAASTRARLVPIALAAIAVAMTIATAYQALRPQPAPALVRLDLVGPGEQLRNDFALSPDGRIVAFAAAAAAGAQRAIWVRPLSSDRAYPLAGTEGGFSPFWSPNGDELGFVVVAGNTGQVRKVPASGGQSQAIGEVPHALQGTWNRDGIILVSQGGGSCVECVLFQVPSAGGIPKPAHARDSEGSHRRWASFLPDGRHYLFALVGTGVERGLYLGELDSNEKTRLSDVVSGAYYANGHVFFVADGRLVAQPFDVDRLRMAGDPVQVLENVAFSGITVKGAFAVSDVAIVARASAVPPLRQLTWMDRSGAIIKTLGEPADVSIGDLSPDGGRLSVIYARQAGGTGELWAWDLARQVFAPLRSGEALTPRYSPHGTRIAFRSSDGIRVMAAGGGDEKLLVPWRPMPLSLLDVGSWSADGRHIAYSSLPAGAARLVDASSGTDATGSVPGRQFMLSPAGGWVAYRDISSSNGAIFVEPFDGTPPTGSARVQVSTAGGRSPRWRADGRELYYLSGTNQLMAVSVTPGSRLTLGTPTPLFETASAQFDVTTDGQRFIVEVPVGDVITPPISVLLNWRAMLPK